MRIINVEDYSAYLRREFKPPTGTLWLRTPLVAFAEVDENAILLEYPLVCSGVKLLEALDVPQDVKLLIVQSMTAEADSVFNVISTRKR